MSKYAPTTNENWVTDENAKSFKKAALKLKQEFDKRNEGKRQVLVRHPELKNTFIVKYT